MAGTETSAADVHPNDDLLLALHDGALFSGDRTLVEGHLKACSRCRARLTALTEDLTPAEPEVRSTRLVRRVGVAIVLVGIVIAAGVVGWWEIGRRAAQPVALATSPSLQDREAAPPVTDIPSPPAPPLEAPAAAPPALAETAPAISQPAAPVPVPAPSVSVGPEPLVITSPNRNFRWRVVGMEVERTNDGGQQWRKQAVELTKPISAGTAPSAAVCWLVGREGAVFVAVGAQWKNVSLTESLDLVGVSAFDSMSATVTAADGRRFSTSDSGASWVALQ